MLAPTREPRLLVAQATMPPSGDELPRHQLLGERLKAAGSAVGGFIDRRYFLVGVVAAVALAAGFPSVGRRGGPLRPEITVVWGATCGIFLLAGLGLPTSDLARAAANFRLHGLIQAINLCLIPLGTLAVCTPLVQMGLLAPVLRDGMLVMAALPTTVNMCVALTRSSAGDEALAIFNAVLGNILGVLLTPALLLTLVGTSGALSVVETLQKLSTKVVLPLVIGQLLRPALNKSGVLTRRKKLLSRTSESLLLYVVFSTFCDTFLRGFGLVRRPPPIVPVSRAAQIAHTLLSKPARARARPVSAASCRALCSHCAARVRCFIWGLAVPRSRRRPSPACRPSSSARTSRFWQWRGRLAACSACSPSKE